MLEVSAVYGAMSMGIGGTCEGVVEEGPLAEEADAAPGDLPLGVRYCRDRRRRGGGRHPGAIFVVVGVRVGSVIGIFPSALPPSSQPLCYQTPSRITCARNETVGLDSGGARLFGPWS